MLKVFCSEEKTLAANVLENLIKKKHELVKRDEADLLIDLLSEENGKNLWLERDRVESTKFYLRHGIKIPKTEFLNQKKEFSIPFVFKFSTDSTSRGSLGPQTVVVKKEEDFQQLLFSNSIYKSENSIIQEYVVGREFTVTVLVGEKNWIYIGVARDYKKLFDDETGPNTYGMGSISPVKPHPDVESIIEATLGALEKEGKKHEGFLSFQFIENEDLFLLECNVRLCMPEFQSMSKLIDGDIAERLFDCYNGNYIKPLNFFQDKKSVTINLVSKTFPFEPQEKINLSFDDCEFEVITDKSNGTWCNKTFIAGINNSGYKSFDELGSEIYKYLNTINQSNLHFRKDIGKK
jgi:phosphoribosylamine-glycine ligase